MFAPGIPGVLRDFHSSSIILASFVVSVYLIGYAFGPLLCAPLSEFYGRYWVYQISNILFVCFTIGCALAPTLNSLIGFRFLAGSAGSAPLVLGGGSVADLYPREKRGAKMSLFALGPLLGPVIGMMIRYSPSRSFVTKDRSCSRRVSSREHWLAVGLLGHNYSCAQSPSHAQRSSH